jgi:hypothetical protein
VRLEEELREKDKDYIGPKPGNGDSKEEEERRGRG